jgi:hypothetical protein
MDNLNIFIEGDDDGFNSQNAKFKFKQTVKQQLQNNNAFFSSDYSKLFNKYIKDDYELKFKSFKDGNVTVSLNKKVVPKNNFTRRELLKSKIKMMSDKRTNANYYKAKNSDVVPDDVLDMYKKASKLSNVPIPEPDEILKHPEQYKILVESMLSNPEFVKNNTPYFKYFKLLGDKLGVKVSNDTHVVSNDNTYKVNNDTPLNTTLNKDDTESDSD